MIETLSASARRLEEKKRSSEFVTISNTINSLVPQLEITWILPNLISYYTETVQLMTEHYGILNFHDCLIAQYARRHNVKNIARFDVDFDKIEWLKRIF
ncbi:PIN domain-containing protein [candidate division KSB1 bacterium]|nr:PIN domain-containing protein [candidate division KSB1 bacterium]